MTRVFEDEDEAYLNWVARNDGGYVLNINRSHTLSTARIHEASCRWISGSNSRGGPWTGRYIKVCADTLAELDAWRRAQNLQPIATCGTCSPS